MAGFDEVRLFTEIEWGAVGGPGFQTDVIAFDSGQEQRVQNWQNARGRWDIAYGIKTRAEMAALVAFFRERRGKARGFRFKDHVDHQLSDERIGTGDGATTAFQVIKTYGSTNPETRTIRKLVSGTLVVRVDGIAQTGGGSDYDVNLNTGVITFEAGSIPAAGLEIRVDAEFDVPVRFDTDQMRVSLDDVNLTSWGSIPIVEIDPEDLT